MLQNGVVVVVLASARWYILSAVFSVWAFNSENYCEQTKVNFMEPIHGNLLLQNTLSFVKLILEMLWLVNKHNSLDVLNF